jgi:hypothetical protein
MAASLPDKSLKPQSPPATTKLNLIALKPLVKTDETQPSSPPPVEPPLPEKPTTSVEPTVPLEPTIPVSSPTPVSETPKTLKPAKPIKRAPTPPPQIDQDLPENSNAIFQGVGIIVGDVTFCDKKAHVTISSKEYPLFYASSHKKAFEALKIHIKKTAKSQLRLIVYPRVMHFPKREQPYLVGFQLVGFQQPVEDPVPPTKNNSSLTIDQELQDFEFKLSGLWQFIPVCQSPCITVQKNFSEERLTYIKEAPIEQKVNFMKASHIPVMWRDAPIRPFRFNPRLEKEQQGQASFVEIKAEFLPDRDVFEFRELRSKPTIASPRSLKAGKKQKAEALKAKTQRKKEQKQQTPPQSVPASRSKKTATDA